MMNKPIQARGHGIIDYLFAAVQLGVPSALGLNPRFTKAYALLGTGFLTINALTDTPVGIKRVISLKGHQRADALFLTGLAALTLAGFIRRKPAARSFHLLFLGTAVANYLLTDYDSQQHL